MHSKISDPYPASLFLWKAKKDYSEEELSELAQDFSKNLKPGELVFLDGELGAGKTTFARSIILSFGVSQAPQGSPTFSIVHEYDCSRLNLKILHMDLYRLKTDLELDEAGIYSFLEEDITSSYPSLILCEWASLFPRFRRRASCLPHWVVSLEFSSESKRTIEIRAAARS